MDIFLIALKIICLIIAVSALGYFILELIAEKFFSTAFVRVDQTYFEKRAKRNRKSAHSTGPSFADYRKKGAEYLRGLKSEEYRITSFDGLNLVGSTIKNPYGDAHKLLVAVHGYRGSGYSDFGGQAEFWFRHGFDIFLPDNRAHGQSEGDYIGFGVTDSRDIVDWLEFLQKNDGRKVILFGISMGCAAVLNSLDGLPSCVEGVIADCGYSSLKKQFATVGKWHIEPALPLVRIKCKNRARYDFYSLDTTKKVSKTDLPILFIHGAEDKFVKPSSTKDNYAACVSRKDILVIEGAGHPKSHFVAPAVYEGKIEEFFGLKVKF